MRLVSQIDALHEAADSMGADVPHESGHPIKALKHDGIRRTSGLKSWAKGHGMDRNLERHGFETVGGRPRKAHAVGCDLPQSIERHGTRKRTLVGGQ